MTLLPSFLESTAEQLVNLVTFGQLSAIKAMFDSWLSSAPSLPEPNILSYTFALFIVVIRFLVPIVLAYHIIIKNIFKTTVLRLTATLIYSLVYALFYFNPIEIFNKTAESVNAFYYFLQALPSIKTQPFLFVALTNGAIVFGLRVVITFITLWVFFMVITTLTTTIFWLITAGKNLWAYTDKNFKAFTLQLTIAFLIFYPLLGAFRAFLTLLALIIASANLKDAFYTMRGYQKVCYADQGTARCRWAR